MKQELLQHQMASTVALHIGLPGGCAAAHMKKKSLFVGTSASYTEGQVKHAHNLKT